MGTPVAPIKIEIGDKVQNFVVKKKLGEGACGQVFLVNVMDKTSKVIGQAAMKVEPRMDQKIDEVLKMEIFVLQKLQKSHHSCRLLASGHAPTYTYLVMSLLGNELYEIRRRLPNRKMTANNVLRVGIQLIRGLQDIHEAGFVHRDVKPSNMAVGHGKNPMVIYVFDFGLARQLFIDDKKGGRKLREPRAKVMFRGTVRYCSLNVHKAKEQGRHDDMIGLLYSLIECATGNLPWKGKVRKESEKLKQNTTEAQACKDCPPSFLDMYRRLKSLTYHDVPPYQAIMCVFKNDLPKPHKMSEPYEWMKPGVVGHEVAESKGKSDKEKAEADRDNPKDEWTLNEVEESVVTEETNSKAEYDPAMCREDTLDQF